MIHFLTSAEQKKRWVFLPTNLPPLFLLFEDMTLYHTYKAVMWICGYVDM